MTNHAELSRDLAQALGWQTVINGVTDYEMRPVGSVCRVTDPNRDGYERKDFDYRDPTVCLPLIEWLMREHDVSMTFSPDAKQFAVLRAGGRDMEMIDEWADTFPEAVARAVIAVKK